MFRLWDASRGTQQAFSCLKIEADKATSHSLAKSGVGLNGPKEAHIALILLGSEQSVPDSPFT